MRRAVSFSTSLQRHLFSPLTWLQKRRETRRFKGLLGFFLLYLKLTKFYLFGARVLIVEIWWLGGTTVGLLHVCKSLYTWFTFRLKSEMKMKRREGMLELSRLFVRIVEVCML